MSKYAIFDMDVGRITISSFNLKDILDCFDKERKAGHQVALIKLIDGGKFWEIIK